MIIIFLIGVFTGGVAVKLTQPNEHDYKQNIIEIEREAREKRESRAKHCRENPDDFWCKH